MTLVVVTLGEREDLGTSEIELRLNQYSKDRSHFENPMPHECSLDRAVFGSSVSRNIGESWRLLSLRGKRDYVFGWVSHLCQARGRQFYLDRDTGLRLSTRTQYLAGKLDRLHRLDSVVIRLDALSSTTVNDSSYFHLADWAHPLDRMHTKAGWCATEREESGAGEVGLRQRGKKGYFTPTRGHLDTMASTLTRPPATAWATVATLSWTHVMVQKSTNARNVAATSFTANSC